jgi:hypothetical protein
MPLLSDLAPAELARRLAGPGLHVETGPFIVHVRSPHRLLAQALHQMYGAYPLAEAGFADFHLSLAQGRGWHRWLRPQARFLHDGVEMFEPLPASQVVPMFEWCLNWCVSSRAHEYLMLHAAVLERHGQCAILPAPPGSGKSTLCAALAHHGWRLLSDELALVQLSDGMVAPLPRPISLKNASIEVIRRALPEAVLGAPVSDTVKGTVAYVRAPSDSVARARVTARPAWVVCPRYVAGAELAVTPLAPAPAHMTLAENAFNYSMLGADGFAALAALVDGVQAWNLSYSRLDEALAWFDALAGTP